MAVENSDRIQFLSSVRGYRKASVKNKEISETALRQNLPLLRSNNVTAFMYRSFGEMVRMHNQQTKAMALGVLQPIYDNELKKLEEESVENKTLSLLDKVYTYDYDTHNSSGQAARKARGYFQESVFDELLKYYVKDQFLTQVPVVHSLRKKFMDFVIGSSVHEPDNPHLLYVSVKKSIRERGDQILIEKRFLGEKTLFFFCADEEKKLSKSILEEFYEGDIVVVTYEHMVGQHYADCKHVISYEKFFLDLIPKYFADKEAFKITDVGIETRNNKVAKQGFSIVKVHA